MSLKPQSSAADQAASAVNIHCPAKPAKYLKAPAFFNILLAGLAYLIACERDAYAYIDPGSGALMWQALIAGLFGSVFYFRNFWKRMWSRGKRNQHGQPPTHEQ